MQNLPKLVTKSFKLESILTGFAVFLANPNSFILSTRKKVKHHKLHQILPMTTFFLNFKFLRIHIEI